MHSPSIPTIDSNLVSSSHSLNFLLLLFPLPSPSVLLLLGGRSGRPAPCHLCPPPPPPPQSCFSWAAVAEGLLPVTGSGYLYSLQPDKGADDQGFLGVSSPVRRGGGGTTVMRKR